MTTSIDLLLFDLNEKLNLIDLEIDNTLLRCEKAIEIISKAVHQLKNLFKNEGINTIEKEIDFFKNVKPKFTSKLIYYNNIYKIEAKMPYGGRREIKRYLNNELDKIKQYFYDNHDFNKYHRTGSTYLDSKYYVRGTIDIKLTIESFFFEVDHSFSTSHDFKLAKIIAHDLIQVYLEDRLRELDSKWLKEKVHMEPNFKLKWTAPKVALTELLYALNSEGVFNNGTADLKDIAEFFEYIFEIDLGQYRRTFLEIRARKSDKTKFISSLNDALLKRMDNADDII